MVGVGVGVGVGGGRELDVRSFYRLVFWVERK